MQPLFADVSEQGDTFADVVQQDLIAPIKDLCALFHAEQAHPEFAFFSNLLFHLQDPEDEAEVLSAVIELSRCAFLGFAYSEEARVRIDALLERAITLSHTMSAANSES